MKYYAEEEQAGRRSHIAALAVKYMEDGFDGEGRWLGGRTNSGLRETLTFALTYLEEGSEKYAELANRAICRAAPGGAFCHFSPFLCMELFWHFGDRLDAETKSKMDVYVLRWLDAFTEPELEFIGCNDNFPLMAAGTLLGGGLRYGRPELVRMAAERLDQLRKMLLRRGFTAEYTSPTYTPIQALCLAELAAFAQQPERFGVTGVAFKDGMTGAADCILGSAVTAGRQGEATAEQALLQNIRTMALAAETRVHMDLLIHMHWPTAQLGGAFSRGYAVDSVGSTYHARFLYYMLYGDELLVNPLKAILGGKHIEVGQVVHHNEDFLRISFAWQALPQYHCPAALAEWAKNRTYPYTVTGTAESVSGRDLPPMDCAPAPSALLPAYWEYPEHVNLLTTYMTQDYALGTARYGWLGGMQSHSLQLLYRKKADVRSQRDMGTMFTRYVINDHEIFGERDINWEQGVCVTQQKENTALALYTPRLLYDSGISSLKLTVNFSDLFGDGLDELWLGDRQLMLAEGGTAEAVCVYVRTGDIYICLKPLNQTPPDRNLRCTVRRVKNLIEIAFISYRGEARSFDRMELGALANGVAVEVRTVAEYDSFAAFRRAMQPKADDYLFRYFGRAVRRLRYENEGRVLENEYSPLSLMMRYAMENGSPVPEPRLYSSEPVPGMEAMPEQGRDNELF